MQLGLLCCTSTFTEKGNSCTRLSTLHIFFFSILSCIIYLLSFILKGSKKHACRNHKCLYIYIFTYARDRIQVSLSDLTLYHHSFVKIRLKILLLPDADIFLVRNEVNHSRISKCSKLHLQFSEAWGCSPSSNYQHFSAGKPVKAQILT